MKERRGSTVARGLGLGLALALLVSSAALAEEKGWKSRAEIAYVRTGGNTDTETLAGKVTASLDQTPNRYFAKGETLFSNTDGEETSNRWLADGRYERALTDRLFAFLTASYLKDKFAGYDSKISVGPGMGYEFVKTENHNLKGMASLQYTWDNYVDNGDDSYVTGRAVGDYGWKISDNLKFRQFAEYIVSMEDTSVYFLNSESGLEVKVNSNIALGLSYIVNYQNDAPKDTDHTDTRFLTSLVVDF